MNIPVEEISEPRFYLSVEKEPWKRVESLDSAGPHDQVYTVDRDTGKISFGDGINGRKPNAESSISATYEFGGGASGNVGEEPIITLKWTLPSQQMNQIIGAIIEHQDDGIIFRVCREFESPHRWKWISKHCKNIMRENKDRKISGGLSISDMLLGKIKKIRKLSLRDLVLSVLPRPFHKDLPEPGRKYLVGGEENEPHDASDSRTKDIFSNEGKYIIKENDTLQSISREVYGTPEYYLEIAKVNRLVNFRKLKTGSSIKLPSLDKTDI